MSDPSVLFDSDEMSLRDYAGILRRRKWIILIPLVVVPLVALLSSLAQTKQYSVSTDVLVREPPSASAIGAPERPMQQRVLQNELQRAQGSAMRDQVRLIIGDEPTISVRLAADEDVDVFVFTGSSSSPELAAAAANAYADVYIEERRESITVDLEAQAGVLRDQLGEISDQLDQTTSDEQFTALDQERKSYEFQLDQLETSINLANQSGATVIDAAQVDSKPVSPTPRRTTAFALIVGLFLGIAVALLVDYFDNSLRGEDDLGKAVAVPVLGVIPRLKHWKQKEAHVVTREEPTSAPAEAYRAFRTAVHYLSFDRGLKVIQITSAKPGDGKTTTSTNLAVASARAGQSVLLIDCDLRRPRVHEFFGLRNEVGFTTSLVGASLDEVIQEVEGEPRLSIISSGPQLPDPSEILASATARGFIESTRERFDLVIIDSPPVLAVSDPLVLLGSVDGVILVASAKQSDRRDVVRATEQLSQLDTVILGTVLNSFDQTSSSDYRQNYGVYERAAP